MMSIKISPKCSYRAHFSTSKKGQCDKKIIEDLLQLFCKPWLLESMYNYVFENKVFRHVCNCLGPTPGAHEMVGILVNAGLYDLALTVCHAFSISLYSVFSSLALR